MFDHFMILALKGLKCHKKKVFCHLNPIFKSELIEKTRQIDFGRHIMRFDLTVQDFPFSSHANENCKDKLVNLP